MSTIQERQRVLKYASHVVGEITYYTPDHRRVTALGPVGDTVLDALSKRPPKNVLSTARELTWAPFILSTNLHIPLFWLVSGGVFFGLTVFGPFSIFEGGGVFDGIWGGMANTGISVGVGASLYLLEGWLAKREASGWAKYDTLVSEGWTASLVADDDVSTVADLIVEVEAGADRLARCGLSTDEHMAQLVPLVEDAMLGASDCHRSYRKLVEARRMLAGISSDAVDNDAELRQLEDDRRAIESETSEAFARWMNTRRNLDHLAGEIRNEADLADAKLAATKWNAEHRTGRQ